MRFQHAARQCLRWAHGLRRHVACDQPDAVEMLVYPIFYILEPRKSNISNLQRCEDPLHPQNSHSECPLSSSPTTSWTHSLTAALICSSTPSPTQK